MSEPTTASCDAPRWWTPDVAIATGFYVGLSPVAPGTVGTLWGFPLIWLLHRLPELGLPGLGVQIIAIMVLFFVGVPICTWAARNLRKKDPGAVVWDEIVTLPITFLGLESELVFDWRVAILGFVLHRIFDISKIPPAKQLEKLPEGWGIMADDLCAGCYSWAALQLVLYFWKG